MAGHAQMAAAGPGGDDGDEDDDVTIALDPGGARAVAVAAPAAQSLPSSIAEAIGVPIDRVDTLPPSASVAAEEAIQAEPPPECGLQECLTRGLSAQASVDEETAAQCLICLHGLLEQDVCALRCGHVYHSACFQQWLLKGKGDCPQCKVVSRTSQLRILRFEMAAIPYESLEEVLRLEAAPPAERARLNAQFGREITATRTELDHVSKEVAELRAARDERKRLRIEMEQAASERDIEFAELKARLEKSKSENGALQDELDQQALKQQRRLHIPALRDDDADYLEEKRKIRIMRPADRAKQLHQALLVARQQEQETRILASDRRSAAEIVEGELRKQRQQDSRLRRQLTERAEDLRRQDTRASSAASQDASLPATMPDLRRQDTRASAHSVASGSAATSQDASLPATLPDESQASPSQRTQAAASAPEASPVEGPPAPTPTPASARSAASAGGGRKASAAAGPADEDSDFLYGAPARRTAAAASRLNVLARGMAPPAKRTVSVVDSAAPPRRRGLQSLFTAQRV